MHSCKVCKSACVYIYIYISRCSLQFWKNKSRSLATPINRREVLPTFCNFDVVVVLHHHQRNPIAKPTTKGPLNLGFVERSISSQDVSECLAKTGYYDDGGMCLSRMFVTKLAMSMSALSYFLMKGCSSSWLWFGRLSTTFCSLLNTAYIALL